MTRPTPRFDSDVSKGAAEGEALHTLPVNSADRPDLHGNLSDQLPHRNSDPRIYEFIGENDTDFPEPGSNPEHTGQKFA